MILEIFDLLIQYLGIEFLRAFIERISEIITQIVGQVLNCEKINANEVFPTLDILHQSENFVIDKKPDLLINSDDSKKIFSI